MRHICVLLALVVLTESGRDISVLKLNIQLPQLSTLHLHNQTQALKCRGLLPAKITSA